jgi:ATP-dependent Clp protease ATP-binding subunit ClpX
MYEIPGRDDIEKVVVTENTVKNGDHPTMILHQSKKEAPKARKDKSA